jgi:NADP-dependent 3-hydroxy acid dehydrogenase YdfG
MSPIALITGATSGIGRETAKMLADLKYNLIITGRRLVRLEMLKEELMPTGVEVTLLNFDIRNRSATIKAWESLPANLQSIDILINNAGLAAGADPIQTGNEEDWDRMFDTNVKGLLNITKLIIPEMIKRKKGHIINISSIAGSEVYANGNVYCASKHAVQALTKGMRIDLLPYNIKVSSVSPGMVETEFSIVRYHGDTKAADKVYQGLIPLKAEDVAEAIRFMVTRPDHVNVNDIQLMPTAQASAIYNHRIQ